MAANAHEGARARGSVSASANDAKIAKSSSHVHLSEPIEVLLPTAIINIQATDGLFNPMRALLDPGLPPIAKGMLNALSVEKLVTSRKTAGIAGNIMKDNQALEVNKYNREATTEVEHTEVTVEAEIKTISEVTAVAEVKIILEDKVSLVVNQQTTSHRSHG
ncbi:hypothetical protein ACJJTC_000751 [Scirpophaga incertulas]